MRRTTMCAMVLALAGCMADVGDPELDQWMAEEVGATSDELLHSPLSDDPEWAVIVRFGSSYCSASVLSEHWILTAAHCIDHATYDSRIDVSYANAPGSQRLVYRGPARFHPRPGYDPNANNGVNGNDIGLIQLLGVPIDTRITSRAKILVDSRTPWSSSVNEFDLVGWGRGSDPGGMGSCNDVAGKALRRDHGTNLWASGSMVNSRLPIACRGDSGGPWVSTRGGESMVFGVMSGTTAANWWSPHTNHGVRVDLHLDWIKSTIRSSDIFGASCWTRHAGGWAYLECEEYSRGATHYVGLGDKCLQVAGGAATTGALLEIAGCRRNASLQLFSPMPNGEILATGGLCVDVQGGRTDNRTPLWLRPCNGTNAQRFGLYEDGTIRSALDVWSASPNCVEVAGGRTADGTPVQTFDCNGTGSQVWRRTNTPPASSSSPVVMPAFSL